jgi:mono/diheme cytochrome c family protein
MKPISWLSGLLMLVLIVVGAGVLVWSGAFNIAADDPHWPLTERLMNTARDRSIAVRTSDVVVPTLDDESQIHAGAGNYDAMCAGCHLQPGVERSEASAGLYPAPPNLTRHRTEDAARAFWVIKHGIKMSGMPAWGRSMEDEPIWGMVAFLRQLPDLSPDRYRELVAASGGHSHGGEGDEPQDAGENPPAAQDGETKPRSHADAPPHEH